MRNAFSLVELSIVLVILGLLVGGILAGQSLIRAAELRSVGTEQDRFQTAIFAFRDKYFYLPGDLPNATSLWPTSANGNGNGFVGTQAYHDAEALRAWQQLALAGLIEGSYTGSGTAVAGSNLPATKLTSSGGWGLFVRNTSAEEIYGVRSNFLYLGSYNGTNYWGTPLKPEESWSIDSKLDDGMPGTGRMLAGSDSTACVTPGSLDYGPTANRAVAYRLTNSTADCRLWFKQ